MKRTLYFAAFLIVLAGCGGPNASEKSVGAKGTTSGTAMADHASQPAKAPTLDDIPQDLKHAGYEYYGLGNAKTITYEVTSSTRSGGQTGTQSTKLTEVKDGEATFTVEQGGELAAAGESELTLRKDGIYVKSSSVMKVGANNLEFPADVTPGKTWTSSMEIDMNDQHMKIDNKYKVVGPAKVTVKAGKYDALLVTSTGDGKINGQKAHVESSNWYVKGLGAVKATFKTMVGGKAETSSMQMVK